jgi:hypothetical protein
LVNNPDGSIGTENVFTLDTNGNAYQSFINTSTGAWYGPYGLSRVGGSLDSIGYARTWYDPHGLAPTMEVVGYKAGAICAYIYSPSYASDWIYVCNRFGPPLGIF